MKYAKGAESQEKWTIAIKESVASFLFVLLYFLLINPVAKQNAGADMWIGAMVFTAVYFAIGWYYKPHASIHILPVVSFIKALHQDTFKCFLLRVSGQVSGAFAAAFIVFYASGGVFNVYDLMLVPLHPFLTGLFTGLLAQVIYFLYFFLILRKNKLPYFRFFLFSLGLGVLYLIAGYLQGITLLNPFGLLLDYMLNAQTINFGGLLTGIVVHVLVPILFITGTHYFVVGFFIKSHS